MLPIFNLLLSNSHTVLIAAASLSLLLVDLSPLKAAELEQQLDIQPQNATQGAARDVADRWMQLGAESLAVEEYDRAIAAWSEAAKIYAALGDTASLGPAYDNIGVTYAKLGQYRPAEQALRRRIAVARDNRDRPGEVYGLNNLGNVLLQAGQIVVAKAAFTDALTIAESIQHDAGIGLSLSNLGLVATFENDLDTAVQYLESAAAYRYDAGDVLGEAHTYVTLGDVYRRLDRLSNAIGAYRLALGNAVEAGDHPIQLKAIDGLLAIYLQRQDWADVQAYLEQRSALTLAGPATVQTVITLKFLGDYYAALGDLEAARHAYGQALNLANILETARPQRQQLINRLLQLS